VQGYRVKPNLDRIPGDRDTQAQAILRRLPELVSSSFLDSLDGSDCVACARYGARQPTLALRTGSADRLRDALMATALAALLHEDDPRDTMVGLAIHVHVARALSLTPSDLFSEVADRIPAGEVAMLFRTFGTRDDVTLEAFGWLQVHTADGLDFAADM
jgi:hypothetical protein